MRSPTASGRPRPRPRRVHSLARYSPAAITLLAVAFLGACEMKRRVRTVPAVPVRLANRPPVIQAVVMGVNGVRARAPRLGTEVDVRVVASDPDGGRLQYHWVTDPDTGLVQATGPATARWRPPAGVRQARLRIRVEDSRGAMAERVVVAAAEPSLVFGGVVMDPGGRPIPGAIASVDGEAARTDQAGRFSIRVADRGQSHFMLHLAHPAYGPMSHVLAEPVPAGRWTLARATVATVSLAQQVAVQVSGGSCASIPSSRVNWTLHARQHVPVTAQAGRAYTARASADVAAALAWAEHPASCPDGFRFGAPANAFVRANGTPASGTGQVALTQVPAWGGASMPGDYTVRRADGTTRAMESYGAATVRVTSGGEDLRLAPGQKATLSWPADSVFRRPGTKLAGEIPLLRFADSTGEWVEAGVARLDRDGTMWTAEVDHLSEFNMDILKADQACVRIDASALSDASIELEVTIPRGGFATVRSAPIDLSVERLHALYNLPANTDIALRAFRDVAGVPTPLGTFLVNTGAPQDPTDPNRPVAPYDACKGSTSLVDLGVTVTITDTDNDPTHSGMLVPVYMGVVDLSTGNLLANSAGGFAVTGIFDNGSTSVFVSDAVPNGFTGGTTSDAALLGATQGLSTTLRVSPVDLAASAATAPMDAHASGANPANAEATPVMLKVSGAKILSLAGAPFAVGHIAWVDYTMGIAVPGSTDGRIDAWSRYYTATETGYPVWEVQLPMVRFGLQNPGPPYTIDSRFLLTGVTFYHTTAARGTRAVGHAVPGSTDLIWYDVGSTWTAISSATAVSLGLTDAESIGPCYASGSLFRIDRVELVGAGGRYVVQDAMVCRDDASMVSVAGTPTIGLVGSNLFRRVAIVVDGPNNTFGILRP